jgi:hypothetical protein
VVVDEEHTDGHDGLRALGVIDEEGTALAAFVHHGMAPEVVRDIGHLPRGMACSAS